MLKLREQVEKLTRQTEEANKARVDTQQKARLASTRTTLREALDAKGIKGARATAVLALMEQQGALRFNEDGTPELVIKRARSKGARAEELVFDDLAAGVEDWSKSADAAEFLPAPQPVAAARRPGFAPAPSARPAGGTSRPMTDQEVADQLTRQGIHLDDLASNGCRARHGAVLPLQRAGRSHHDQDAVARRPHPPSARSGSLHRVARRARSVADPPAPRVRYGARPTPTRCASALVGGA